MSMPIKFKIGTDSHMLTLVKYARMLKPYDPLSLQEDYYFPSFKKGGPYVNRNKI